MEKGREGDPYRRGRRNVCLGVRASFSLQVWLWGGFGIGFDGRRCMKSGSDGVRRMKVKGLRF